MSYLKYLIKFNYLSNMRMRSGGLGELKTREPRTLLSSFWVKALIGLVLLLCVTSCGDKAVSQDGPFGLRKNQQPISMSNQFAEVAPPKVIQELHQTLETYQPQVTILSPQADEILQDNKVTVALKVKGLPIFQDPQLGLGPYLQLILDDQPFPDVYDLSQPLILEELSPGTHTLRVFAERPWHESFKNEGAYAQTTFHIFTKTDDHNPDTSRPLITYNHPKGNYGAEPILLDFYLTNAPLQLLAKDNPQEEFADWRIRCTINGESFVLDRWQAIYLKGFKLGKNWVKLEFLDNQGHPVKNGFNSTIGLFNYEPKGKDTLSQIVRGELVSEKVKAIVDPSYIVKIPTPSATPVIKEKVEETPVAQPKAEDSPVPKVIAPPLNNPGLDSPEPQPEVTPTPEPTLLPETTLLQPEVTPAPEPTPLPETTLLQPEVTPAPEPTPLPETTLLQPEVTPTPEPEKALPKKENRRHGRYFQRRERVPTPQPTAELSPNL
jgi:hypothetical protein